MRKTIRRSIFVTATAACAVGFGLFQAAAAPVPTVPELPLSGLGALTNLDSLSNLTESTSLLPTMPTMPTMPGAESRNLPLGDLPLGDLTGTGELDDLLKAASLAKDLLGLGDLTDMAGLLPTQDLLTTKQLLPTDGLPIQDVLAAEGTVATEGLPTDGLAPSNLLTGDLGLPTASLDGLPLDLSQLIPLPKLPTRPSDITDSPIVDMLQQHRLPLLGEDGHKRLVEKVARGVDGVDVQEVANSEAAAADSQTDIPQLPATAPQTVSVQSGGVPENLPAVSGVETPGMPSINDLSKLKELTKLKALTGLLSLPKI
ncbi:hypothetical protein KIPE111705_16270 [Kibdelosporangium persicum]|uniref:GLTT repeat-containing protein n=1 Tax=Kibdelosporangium persicum TaxID=2698649 RepID=A0ABX2EY78_9PSEU|nr:hypothetical protein [Kibdelosporangium persicum]NRN63942.1 hypothetical protein [Kibdelosporangium persicum]